ncbi:DUF1775 domain-containing protein [Streptomyces sp. SID8378]|nr:DUF1775 domain-containing protein [Streptomyces sp. SID8378]
MAVGKDAAYSVAVRQLPDAKTLAFKTLQSYDDGRVNRWVELEKSTGGARGTPHPCWNSRKSPPAPSRSPPAPVHRALSPQRPRRPARRVPSRQTRRRSRRTMRRPRRKRRASRSPCRSASS